MLSILGLLEFCFIGFVVFLSFKLIHQTIITAARNVTIWEMKCRSKIDYLQDYPEWLSPFSKGTLENFKEFFTMKKKKMEWSYPKRPNLTAFEVPEGLL